MKNIVSNLFIVITLTILSLNVKGQSTKPPDGIIFQAVASDAEGNPAVNRTIYVKTAIIQSSPKGKEVYNESFKVNASSNGVFTIVIGKGNRTSGFISIGDIDWTKGPYFLNLKAAVEPSIPTASWNAENEYIDMGTSQFWSVPFAQFAGKVTDLDKKVNIADTSNMLHNYLIGIQNAVPYTGAILDVNLGTKKLTVNGLYVDQSSVKISNILNILGAVTNIDNLLNVKGAVKFENIFRVAGVTNLDNDLNVNGIGNFANNVNVNGITNLDNNLNVRGSVIFGNTLKVTGATNLDNRLYVKDVVNFANNLIVSGNSALTGKLDVNGEVNFTNNFLVTGVSNIKNSLNVYGITKLDSSLNVRRNVLITDTTNSSGISNGALVINGGVGIARNFMVGGFANIENLSINKGLLIKDSTQSTNITSGAIIVNGGLGLGKNLNVGGSTSISGNARISGNSLVSGNASFSRNTTIDSALVVKGSASIVKQLTVNGITTLENSLNAKKVVTISDVTDANASSAALVVSGGIRAVKSVNIGNSITVAGNSTLNNYLSVNKTINNGYVAEFNNLSASGNGIQIKIGNNIPSQKNSFITFNNAYGKMVGQVSGQTLSELENDEDYKLGLKIQNTTLSLAKIAIVIAAGGLDMAIANSIAADASTTPCFGFGFCETAPIPSEIAAAVEEVVIASLDLAVAIEGEKLAQESLDSYKSTTTGQVGVSYSSGSADYAEYLPKLNKNETFFPGEVVGIKNGMITKNTQDAEQLFIISFNPIVLGNAKPRNNQNDFEKVAFMGQVPVKVVGKVLVGDYIIANGNNDGFGIGISPKNMKPADYKNIVGVAWEASSNKLISYVNTSVGVHINSLSSQVKKQADEIDTLQKQMNELKNALTNIINQLKSKDASTVVSDKIQNNELNPNAISIFNSTNSSILNNQVQSPIIDNTNPVIGIREMKFIDPNRVVYYSIPKEMIENAITNVRKKIDSKTLKENEMWVNMNDANFRNKFVAMLKDKFDAAIQTAHSKNKIQFIDGPKNQLK